jgi:polyisoprenoid-binding protein YceI
MKTWTALLPPVLVALAVIAAGQASSTTKYAVDAAHSKMTVYVFKSGLFAFAADNHEINAPIVAGSFNPAANTVEIEVNAAKMEVLDPSMPADKRAKVQAKMISSDVLDIEKYTKITFRSTSLKPVDKDRLTVAGNLTLHGQTHPVSLEVTRADAAHFNGSVMIRQSEFGITPIRIAGGTVRVKDDVKVEFQIALKKM